MKTRRPRGRCEAIRVDHGVRCEFRGWVWRDGRAVCGIHSKSLEPRYIEKPGKISSCNASSPAPDEDTDP
jgi:hypothetical protein